MPYIYRNPHKQALMELQKELQERVQQQQWIANRIQELTKAIEQVAPLAEDTTEDGLSLSLPQLCLRVLARYVGLGVSIPRIKEELRLMGVDLSGYRNQLAVLHTTLGRLEKSGLVVPAANSPKGTTHYNITPAGLQSLQRGF